ncbi:putative IS1 transposase [Magnetofaba australis IT-1]|uniref:Putative IS1 transposase n=1 Tax=Magnetofaba australis IT-1 TaxID=1434232 RepID=A0A1Y2K414_9PROT|nr:putative IS1 transposase [Magnetofaba australis IT-1]
MNHQLLAELTPETPVDVVRVDQAEADEMWSFVGSKANPRWSWHAIERQSGRVLAYVFGTRKDAVLKELRKLLEPFGIVKLFTDDWGAYHHTPLASKHFVGKRNTQRIERKHLTWRTRIKRLARKTICFSKCEVMHDTVIGLFINRYEFGLEI